ncbi:hypothetical protein E4U46_002633 [Claviceps purpurea]|nr:hypothetical protein E4U46_002633 [Claviceps purpurea]
MVHASTPIPLFDDMSDLDSKDYELVLGVLEIFVNIGGWTFSDNDTYTQPVFGNIARSSENRQLVTDEVASFLTYYGFDGVELDCCVLCFQKRAREFVAFRSEMSSTSGIGVEASMAVILKGTSSATRTASDFIFRAIQHSPKTPLGLCPLD